MRNYVQELLSHGQSISAISKLSGLTKKAVNGLAVGMTKLKSGSAVYEKIRNLSRRTGYGIARSSGLTAKQATKNRRVILRKETLIKSSVRKVHKSTHGQEFYQLRLMGVWEYQVAPHPRKIIDAYSLTHNTKFPLKEFLEDFDEGGWESLSEQGYGFAHHADTAMDALDECIIHARGQLGDSNWILVQILRLEWIKTVLTPD